MYYWMFMIFTNIGLKVIKLRVIYSFKPLQWLAKYIAHNTQKRTKAKLEFEKDLFKKNEK